MSKFYLIESGPKGTTSVADDYRAILDTYKAIRDRRRELAQRRNRTHGDVADPKSCAHLARLCAWMARTGDETLIPKERLALIPTRIAEQAQDFVGRFESDRPPEAIKHLKRLSRVSQDRNAPHDAALALLNYALCGHRTRNGTTGETRGPLLPFGVVVDDLRGILARAHASFSVPSSSSSSSSSATTDP